MFAFLHQGHSPAGGCLMSLCCDVRIMAADDDDGDGGGGGGGGTKYRIGLNETVLVSENGGSV